MYTGVYIYIIYTDAEREYRVKMVQRKMMYAGAALVVAAVMMMATLVDAQRFNTAGAAMPNTMGVSMNAFDVSETSRVLVRDFFPNLCFPFPSTT